MSSQQGLMTMPGAAGHDTVQQTVSALFFATLVLAMVPFTYMCALCALWQAKQQARKYIYAFLLPNLKLQNAVAYSMHICFDVGTIAVTPAVHWNIGGHLSPSCASLTTTTLVPSKCIVRSSSTF